jgi:hypothetical protein
MIGLRRSMRMGKNHQPSSVVAAAVQVVKLLTLPRCRYHHLPV